MVVIGENILNSLKKGDHKAFEKIFIAYYDRIRIFIFGYIKSEADAEEIAEDLFVNLWLNRESIDTTKSFNSYLHTVARNASLNFLKHKFVRDSHQENWVVSEESFNSEDELIAKETSLLIEMAVDKMPAQRREIYRLSRNEGLKNEEIATRLNTTKRNVESQLSLALKELRKAILTYLLLIS